MKLQHFLLRIPKNTLKFTHVDFRNAQHCGINISILFDQKCVSNTNNPKFDRLSLIHCKAKKQRKN